MEKGALDAGRAVVAPESTIISHGLPCPDNLEVARGLEQEVRSHGAVPAADVPVELLVPARTCISPATACCAPAHAPRRARVGARARERGVYIG